MSGETEESLELTHGLALRDELSALSDAVLDISTVTDVDGVLQRIVDVARWFIGAEYAALGAFDAGQRGFSHFAFSGMSVQMVEAIGALPSGKGVLSVLLDEGRPLRLRQIHDHPRSIGFPPHHPPMSSFLGVPIRHGVRVLGNLYLTNKHGTDVFSAADEALAGLFARHAALALHNAHLHEALARSEERYRLLTEGAPELLLAVDGEGRLTYTNERAAEVLGRSPDELMGRQLRSLVAKQDRSLLDLHLRTLKQGAPRADLSLQVLHASGKPRYLELSLRTAEGQVASFQGVARDVTARHLLADEIAHRSRDQHRRAEEPNDLRDLVALIFQAQEDERARIAGDLHDTTVQTLTAIGRHLRGLSESSAALPPEVIADLSELSTAALAEADEVRRLSRNLRPSVLDHIGIEAALADLCDQLRADGVIVDLSVEGDASRLGERPRTALFRIAQEALTNIRRHGEASRAGVRLAVMDDRAELTITDDGRGFDIARAARGPRSGRLGLAGMRERAAMLGGGLQVESSPASGTIVRAWVPSVS